MESLIASARHTEIPAAQAPDEWNDVKLRGDRWVRVICKNVLREPKCQITQVFN